MSTNKVDSISLLLDQPFDNFFSAAIAWAKSRQVELPKEYYQLEGSMRSRAFTVSGLTNLNQIQKVLTSLNQSLESGETFQQWKEKIKELGLSKHHLDVIFRNHSQNAYMMGHWRGIQANKDDRPYLMYDAINDSRTRPAHRAMDNIIRAVDDPFWSTNYPPNGHRCRCSVISLTEKEIEEKGGITKNIPKEAQPDLGWDYHPMNMDQKLKKIVDEKVNKISPKLANALISFLMSGLVKKKIETQNESE